MLLVFVIKIFGELACTYSLIAYV